MNTSLITQTVTDQLENSLFKKVSAINNSIPSPILRAVVSRVAEISSTTIVNDVIKNSNFHLTDIPNNIIGQINPLNLITGNNGPTNINDNLGGILQTQMSGQITDKVVTLFERELRLALPADKLGLVNFGALSATLTQVLTPTINGSISTALGSFTDSLFGRSDTPKLTVEGVDSLFSSFSPSTALEKINQTFDAALANKALQAAKNFDLHSVNNIEKLQVTQTGFTDPSANFPTKEYAGSSETNKLAQGDARGTVVQTKNKSRMLGAKLPGGDSWDQPESSYRGKYPYNKVTQTESGHIIEIDDTPGSERLHIYHKSGTFVEIDANGSMTKRTAGSSYEIIDKNGKIAIAGKADISINGACNIFVGNNANIEVEGDTNITCHNDSTAQAGGKFNLSSVEEFNIASQKVNIESYGDMNVKSGAKYNVTAATDINEKAGGKYIQQATDTFNIKTDSDVNIDGSKFYWKSGTASAATDATSSNAGVMSGRKTVQDNSVDDPQTMTLADNRSLFAEEETANENDRQEQFNLIIKEGFATAEQLKTSPTVLDTTDVKSENTQVIKPNADLLKVQTLPGNYNLSPNFTLEMLSSKAAVTQQTIVPHSGLMYGDIAYNLQAVALNVLEPILMLYPNAFVTSGFRAPGQNQTSQHPKGQAVDIQFKGATKAEYYDIAKKLARVLNYDQLLLEYCNYTNNPWIHVSFSMENNRTQVSTFFNHNKHSTGLSSLA